MVAVLAGAKPGHGRDRPRPHPLLRRVRRPGGRHRRHHHRDGPGPGRSTPRTCCPGSSCTGPRVEGELHPGPGRPGRHRRGAARRHAPAPHRHAPAAQRAAPGARRPRAPAGIARGPRPAALRLLAPQGAAPRGADRRGRGWPMPMSSPTPPVEVIETSKAEAEALGALAFFDDKYGERVRVVRAGAHSLEFCGGTHVDALGMIGPITVVSEGSIGSNTRRIEAVTGAASLALLGRAPAHRRRGGAACSRWSPAGVLDALQKAARPPAPGREGARSACAGRASQQDAARLAQRADDGVVVHRRGRPGPRPAARPGPGRPASRRPGGGGGRVARRVQGGAWRWRRATRPSTPGSTAKELAQLVGGGGGGSPELAMAGGSGPGQDRRPAGRGPAPARRLARCGWPERGAGGGDRPGRAPHRCGRLRRHRAPWRRRGARSSAVGDAGADWRRLAAVVEEVGAAPCGGGPALEPRRSARARRPGPPQAEADEPGRGAGTARGERWRPSTSA